MECFKRLSPKRTSKGPVLFLSLSRHLRSPRAWPLTPLCHSSCCSLPRGRPPSPDRGRQLPLSPPRPSVLSSPGLPTHFCFSQQSFIDHPLHAHHCAPSPLVHHTSCGSRCRSCRPTCRSLSYREVSTGYENESTHQQHDKQLGSGGSRDVKIGPFKAFSFHFPSNSFHSV